MPVSKCFMANSIVRFTGTNDCFQLYFSTLPSLLENARNEIIVSLVKTHVPASVLATPFLNDHEKIADLVDNASMNIHSLGEDRRCIYSNKFEHENRGFEPHEIVGKHISEMHIEKNANAMITKTFTRASNKERIFENHCRFRGKNDKEFDIILTGNARLKRNGKPGLEYSRSFMRDDSGRKLVEKLARLKQLRALAKSETAARDRLIRNIFTS